MYFLILLQGIKDSVMSKFSRSFWCQCDEILSHENTTITLLLHPYLLYASEESESRGLSNLPEVKQLLKSGAGISTKVGQTSENMIVLLGHEVNL